MTSRFSLPTWAIVLSSALVACDADKSADQQADKKSDAPVAALPADSEAPSVKLLMSLPDFSLTNQDGKSAGSGQLFGKVWVANFIFTECQGSCPLQTRAMKSLQQDLKAHERWNDIELVSISVDPETDTPAKLKQYISTHGVDAEHWSFLTGDRQSIWDLSKNGFRLPVAEDAANKEMPIAHAQQFVLVDMEGRVRGFYDSLDEAAVTELKRDLDIVVNERKNFPENATDLAWMDDRAVLQKAALKKSTVNSAFQFTETTAQSGITFQHMMIDDVGRDYKAVHYDHGNGMAVADVDGDGLLDMYFTTQYGSNELWRNTGDGKFENITDKAGLRTDPGVAVAAAFADIDNDGDADLYVTYVRTGNKLYENDGKGGFTDITGKSGVGVKAHSSGSMFFDYDKDGLLDLFVTNVGQYTKDELVDITLYSREKGHEVTGKKYYLGFKDGFAGHLKPERTEKSVLFRNKGGNQFEDVTEATGLVDTSWTGDAVTIDANNDGWMDLYVLNMQGHDEYYENQQGKSFARKSRDVFQKTSWGAMGGVAFDFDNDGDQDIFITDMHSDMSKEIGPAEEKQKADMQFAESFLRSEGNSIFGNSFFRNNGDGSFTEISEQIGTENYWPWGLSSGDVNADGYEDVFIASSMNYPFRYTANSLMLNDAGDRFIDAEFVVGVEPRNNGDLLMPWFELQCSGADSGRKLCEGESGRKVIWGVLGSRSSAIFDIDNDGDQDIVSLEFNMPPIIFNNDLAQKSSINYLKIDLKGNKSNRDGNGAVVSVHAGGKVYTRVMTGKSGYLGQSVTPVYVGLGSNKGVDKIEVSWPSGTSQVLQGPIKINRTLVIEEG